MNISELLAMISTNLIVDYEKRTLTVTIGPLVLKNVPLPIIVALSKDQASIERLLSKSFIQREVMYVDFRNEIVNDCITSLRDLQVLNEKEAEKFSLRRRCKNSQPSPPLAH